MEINEFNYYFKVRPVRDVALNLGVIYKDLGYNKIDKNKISQIYKLTERDIGDEYYLINISKKVNSICEQESDRLTKICVQLQQMWEGYREEYLNIIRNAFDIKINYNITDNTYCYLQHLPINEVDLKDNIIYLDCNKNIDEIFKNFIIMLTKLILVNRWNYINNWNFNTEFEAKNKIWMFVEIAIDAVFANSTLGKICNTPSYKYFYSLKLKGVNMMKHFRDLYNILPLDDFFTEVYIYVRDSYQKIMQFKNYLY